MINQIKILSFLDKNNSDMYARMILNYLKANDVSDEIFNKLK